MDGKSLKNITEHTHTQNFIEMVNLEIRIYVTIAVRYHYYRRHYLLQTTSHIISSGFAMAPPTPHP